MTETHSVSYSETQSFLSCKRKWEYGYGRSLKKISTSHGLAMGSAGHSVLEAFYRTVLEAGNTLKAQKAALPEAFEAAVAAYDMAVMEGYTDDSGKAPLSEVLFDYYFKAEPFVSQGYLITAVETEYAFDVEATDGLSIRTPIRADLVVVDPKGVTAVVDHKFLGEFITHEQARLEPQIPLYMGGLRVLKYKVGYGIYNMLRTRKIKVATPEQRHLLLEIKPNVDRVSRQVNEQIDTAVEIVEFGKQDAWTRDQKAHRSIAKMNCQYCPFKDLCAEELNGGNVKLMLSTEYELRDRKVFDTESAEAN